MFIKQSNLNKFESILHFKINKKWWAIKNQESDNSQSAQLKSFNWISFKIIPNKIFSIKL